VLVRTLLCGLVVAALATGPAFAQAPAAGAQTTTTDTETRPALPTVAGDTGIWFVPTADTLPSGRWSLSVFGSNGDTKQGLTDFRNFGVTGAYGFGNAELFASVGIIRISRGVRNPTFVTGDQVFGGVAQEFPYVRRSWSKNLGAPVQAGFKYSLISESRGDAMSLAPRIVFTFPTAPEWASHDDYKLNLDLVASREFGGVFQATSFAGAVIRGDADEANRVSVSDGIAWGLGASFPSRSPLRALVEWTGEFVIDKYAEIRRGALVAEDGSIAPSMSILNDPTYFKAGLVWQSPGSGFFVHGGLNYSQGIGDHTIGGVAYDHKPWGFEARIGWHPGAKVYVPPPPPAPVIREVIREVPAPAQPAAPPNRGPNVTVACDPGTLEAGQTSRCTATGTDPDGDPLTFTWTPQGGTLSANTGANVTFSAGQQLGNYPLCVVGNDGRGGTANACQTLQVVARRTFMFDDVHFDFDKYNLRQDALKILDDATQTLMQNPNVRITIEGHCDSIGTVEYNLALGERRANAVRDYLVQRGIANPRLRTVSYGEERPKADNNTAAGRAENRRAALVVIIEQQ
jgi:peptidoglycan-associated lipoprotein